MHVAQLLYPLLLGEYDEVVKAALPEVALGERDIPQGGLARVRGKVQTLQRPPREALLEGGRSGLGKVIRRQLQQKRIGRMEWGPRAESNRRPTV
ncbi:MAG TPA: hypothetical protein VFF64_19450 [Candidatus Eremiobacteraceae bacterium]|nr:hypothetical protein [Candidatus Eremiobacteraceae bacterium]